MSFLKDKIVLITGASSGIGKACAEQCAQQGAHVILTDRRVERLATLADQLTKDFGVNAQPLQLDVQDRQQVSRCLNELPAQWQAIDILINNAGLALSSEKIQNGDPDNWDKMIDTNIKGLLYVTHSVLPGMLERNCGHIINVGSVAGHDYYPGGNIYSATKHAVKAINKSLRIDLVGSAIRVTEIAPGAVHTEFSEVRWGDKAKADAFYADFTPLTADDIADAIVYCATRKPHVNIAELQILPTAQASANHLARNGGTAQGLFN